MSHDERCPRWFAEDEQITCPVCDLIAAVREDERVAALRDALEAVRGMYLCEPDPRWDTPVGACVEAIEALGGERYLDPLERIEDARVRDDERGESGDYCKGWDAGWLAGHAAALRDAVEAITALPAKDQHNDDGFLSLCFDKGEAVAAIEAIEWGSNES